MQAVGVRRAVNQAAEVRREVHRVAGVRREVGCGRRGSGGRCVRMLVAGVRLVVHWAAGTGSGVRCRSGGRCVRMLVAVGSGLQCIGLWLAVSGL
jgi:hypothetical protein